MSRKYFFPAFAFQQFLFIYLFFFFPFLDVLKDLKANPTNYDTWFDYIRLEENNGDVESVRDVYERAIANVPPAKVCVLIHI